MNERQVLMRHFSYSLSFLASSLCLTLLAPSSFGSNHFIQEKTQEKSVAPASQRAVPSESTLPHDVRIYIFSFLSDQKDLLRVGAVSKDWRKAAGKAWEKRWLDLSKKPLTEADYTSLAEGIFPRLKLNEVELDEKAIKILATGSHLQALELRRNNLHATKSFIKLLSLSHLSRVDLYNNQIGAEGAKTIAGALSQNRTLTKVNLYYNSIHAEGAKVIAEALAQNRTLTRINLGGNSIGDEGAKTIAGALLQNTALTTVNLFDNSIGHEAAKAIADALSHNTTLTTFNLGYNSIGDEGAKAIAEALTQNTTLTTINLYGNTINDEGVKTIATMLSQNTTLTRVYLDGNKIGDEGKKALEALKRSRPSLTLEY